jgi:type II secretory pathway component GspD/PulD (secretin)
MHNSSVSQKTNLQGIGILTEAQRRVVFQALEQRREVNILDAPKTTTLSGRPAQMKNVRSRYIVTDLDWSYQGTNGAGGTNDRLQALPLAEPFELGPLLDVNPYALADGQTIQMTLIPTLTEFVGYDLDQRSRREIVTMPDGRKEIVTVPDQPLPIFRKLQMVSSAIVRDGQTVVLAGGSEQLLANPKRNTPLPKGAKMPGEIKTTSLLIFVTPTLVDPAGNRINKPEDLPPGIPAQPPAVPEK